MLSDSLSALNILNKEQHVLRDLNIDMYQSYS